MSNFAADDFAARHYRSLHFGLPGALSFPAIDPINGKKVAVGWYASDDGLVRRYAGFKQKSSNDFRRYFLDLSPLTEVRAGDTIGEVSDISVLASPTTISVGNFDKDGTRVLFTVEAGVPNERYFLLVRCKLTSGTEIARIVQINVFEFV